MATATSRRTRLDLLLVERGLATTRARAQALVMAGQVRVGEGDGARTDLKAGDLVANDAVLTRGRGPALGQPRAPTSCSRRSTPSGSIRTGLVGLDVGASTGGFTDVLLDRGATPGLRASTSATASSPSGSARTHGSSRWSGSTLGRSRPDVLPEPVDLAVVDVSFISLRLVLGPIRSVLRDGRGPIVALVKPQFEAGRAEAKGGVVRDAAVHRRVIAR